MLGRRRRIAAQGAIQRRPAEVLQEPFVITKGDPNVKSLDGIAQQDVFGTIWIYQVPVGIGLLILPGHTFACYLLGADGKEMPSDTRIKITYADSARAEEKTALYPTLYASARSFDDRDKILRLNVAEPIRIYEQQFLKIHVAGLDTAGTGAVRQAVPGVGESYFELTVSRVRQPL